jgi:hypothetical protein
MPWDKKLSPSTRPRNCELPSKDLKHAQIKKNYPETPLGTIKTTLRREGQRGADQRCPQIKQIKSGVIFEIFDSPRCWICCLKYLFKYFKYFKSRHLYT